MSCVADTERWLAALINKDRKILSSMFSCSDPIRYLGSTENENWTGDLLRNEYADHAEEIPDLEMDINLIEAFEGGAVDWATCVVDLTLLGSDKKFTEKFTLIKAHLSTHL